MKLYQLKSDHKEHRINSLALVKHAEIDGYQWENKCSSVCVNHISLDIFRRKKFIFILCKIVFKALSMNILTFPQFS